MLIAGYIMKFISILLFIIILFISCASTTSVITEQQLQKTEELINRKSFKISCDRAYPMVTNALMQLQNAGLFPFNSTAGMVDITGTSSYITFKNDSIDAELPYFGERQFGGVYNSRNIGVAFKDEFKDYKITKFKDKQIKISFIVNDRYNTVESYNVDIYVYPSLKARITINSTHRRMIEYRGFLTEEEVEERSSKNAKS